MAMMTTTKLDSNKHIFPCTSNAQTSEIMVALPAPDLLNQPPNVAPQHSKKLSQVARVNCSRWLKAGLSWEKNNLFREARVGSPWKVAGSFLLTNRKKKK